LPDPVDQRRAADSGPFGGAQPGEAGQGVDGRPRGRAEEAAGSGKAPTRPSGIHRWLLPVGRLLFIFLCIELGLFLIVYPWSGYWETSYFAGLPGLWAKLWQSPYFRGAVSGVGLLDIWLALGEMARLLGWFRAR